MALPGYVSDAPCFNRKAVIMRRVFSIRNVPASDVLAVAGLLVMFLTPICYKEITAGGAVSRLLSSLLYSLPLCFLLASVRNRALMLALSGVMFVTAFIETMMVVLFHNYIISGNIIAIMTTTMAEGGGFVRNSLHALPYSLPVIAGMALVVIGSRKPRHVRLHLVCCAITLLFSAFFVVFQLYGRWENNITPRFYITQNIWSRPPYNFFYQASDAVHQTHLKTCITDADRMTFQAVRQRHEGRETYVLVIGESLRYSNLSVAGYKRRTTPLLEKESRLLVFDNYYATANLTMYSVPQILTRATATDFELCYKEKSVFKPFQECGFKTFAVCCDNLIGYERYLTRGVDSLYAVRRDEDIAGVIDSLAARYEKTFFIVQMKGSHGPYENFRRQDDVFHPNPVSDRVSWDNVEAKVNAYDNTVLYTDFNVSSIIRAIDKPESQAAMMMVSDHGDDFRPGTGGHGGNCNPDKSEYHVPLLFWNSRLWGENNAGKLSQAIIHRSMSLNADNIFYSVCDMADIKIGGQYAREEWSIFSHKLTAHRRLLLVPDGRNCIPLD